jgi:hypothetical protein
MSTAERGCTFPSAPEAAPPLLATIDAHVFRGQRMPLAAVVWDTLLMNSAEIGTGEADYVAFGGFKSALLPISPKKFKIHRLSVKR